MEPIHFPEVTHTLAKDQPQYKPLPVHYKDKTTYDHAHGEMVSCWQLTWRERFILLITGKLWLSQMTFNKPLRPMKLTINKEDVLP